MNNWKATDLFSVFRVAGYLHAILNSCKKKIYSHNLFFLTIIESYTYKDMFSPCRKVLDFRFCPVYIIVTSGPSVLEWAWLSAKYCRGLWEVAIWFRERNSSFTFRKCPRIILFYFFYGDCWIAQRLFAVVTFCLFPKKILGLKTFLKVILVFLA